MSCIAICGLGGSAREILELVKRINLWDEIIFCDKSKDNLEMLPEYLGCKVYTFEGIVALYKENDVVFTISVGDVVLREKIYKQIVSAGFSLANLVAPDVIIPESTKLGNGVIIRDRCYVSVDCSIGCNVMIQPCSVVGHDVKIGAHSVISSQTVLSGAVEVGECSYVAIGCMVKECVKIGSGTIISMGSAVNKNIGDNVIARGNPAEVISRNFLKSAFKLNMRK